VRGIESDLPVLEGEWDQVRIQTGWELEAFYQPVGFETWEWWRSPRYCLWLPT